MEHFEREGFRATLQRMLDDIQQPLARRDEIAVENAPDTLDRVQRAAERELAIRQIESTFGRIQNIRLALERIEDGSYGTCLRCDCPITLKRLQAIPWASHCVRCQDMADRERVEAEASGDLEIAAHAQEVA